MPSICISDGRIWKGVDQWFNTHRLKKKSFYMYLFFSLKKDLITTEGPEPGCIFTRHTISLGVHSGTARLWYISNKRLVFFN